MFIRTIHTSVPSKDRRWPTESKDYKTLLETYIKKGKLLDRIINPLGDHEVEIIWIWDSKDSFLQWIEEPFVLERYNEIKDFTVAVTISDEEI